MHEEDKAEYSVSELISRIYGFVKPYLFLLVLTIVINLFFSTASTATFAIVKPLIQIIFSDGETGNPIAEAQSNNDAMTPDFLKDIEQGFYGAVSDLIVIPGDKPGTLIGFSLLLILLFFVKHIFKYLSQIIGVRWSEGILKSIRDKIFRNLTSLSVGYFDKAKSGSLISIITNDVQILNQHSIASINIIFRDSTQFLLLLIFLMAISTKLTLIAFSTSIISFIVIRFSVKFIRRYSSRMQNAMADYTSTMQESISGIRVVKAYNAEKTVNSRFTDDTSKYFKSAKKHTAVTGLVPSLNEMFAVIALCIVLYTGGLQVINGEMASDSLLTFLIMLFAIMSPVSVLVSSFSSFQRGIVSAERILKVLDQKPTVESGKAPAGKFDNSITVSNVKFSYNSVPVIKDVSFEIAKRKKIALVGPSGSGKSTMLDLIIRFYDPVSGSIKLDGKDIKDFDLSSYRSMFGIVGQESMLFNDTVANNIIFGYDNVSKEELYNAAKISNAYEFIMKLPNGFDTMIGDRGIMLSGGEKQRISIARALLRDPQILIFDEATSSLDSESELVVQEAITRSLKDKTAVIVAHRLATIIDCDEIFVFDGGSIAEHGTHTELLNNGGIYKKLYDIQFTQKQLS